MMDNIEDMSISLPFYIPIVNIQSVDGAGFGRRIWYIERGCRLPGK